MKKYLYILMSTMLIALSAGCGSDEESTPSLLFNQWVMVSYVDDTGEVLKEANGYYYLITFHRDGTYSGRAYGNEIGGTYECIGTQLKFIDGNITKFYVVGSDPDKFFLEHLSDIYIYTITNTELRLYYSKDQYFRFRVKQ